MAKAETLTEAVSQKDFPMTVSLDAASRANRTPLRQTPLPLRTLLAAATLAALFAPAEAQAETELVGPALFEAVGGKSFDCRQDGNPFLLRFNEAPANPTSVGYEVVLKGKANANSYDVDAFGRFLHLKTRKTRAYFSLDDGRIRIDAEGRAPAYCE